MVIPNTWTLNARGLDWLNAEADRWFIIMGQATNAQDKADAKAYLQAVIAERDQRLQQYTGGWGSTISGGLTGVFEMFGGSGGPGAAGLAGGVTDTVKSTATTGFKVAGNVATVAIVGLLIAGFVYFNVVRKA